MNDIDKLNDEFWNERLSGYEAKLFRNAGFQSPVDFFDIPFAGLCQLKGCGFECTCDAVDALAAYMELPYESEFDAASETDKYLLEMGYEPYDAILPENEREYMNVEEFLFLADYDGDKTARMTIRQMLNLKNISVELLEALEEVVWLAYLGRYHSPAEEFTSRTEIIKGKKLLFAERRDYDA